MATPLKVVAIVSSSVCAVAIASVASAEPRPPASSCAADRVPSLSRGVARSLPTAGSTIALRRTAQVSRNDKADMTFALSRTRDGALLVEAKGGELAFRKTVRSDGSFTLELATPQDRATFTATAQSITVARGDANVSLAAHASGEDLARVQRLLADSPAVRLSRAAANAIMETEDDSAEAGAMLLADGLVGMLTGDAGAPSRIARHLARHIRAGIRRAAFDCYNQYELAIWNGWVDYESCLQSFVIWDPTRWLCSARYLVMAEAIWFQFVSCLGFSGLY